MMPRSLTGRLMASLVLVTVAFGITASAAVSITLHREINEAADQAMREAARRLLPLVIDDLFGREPGAAPRQLAEVGSPEDDDRLVFQARDGEGRVLLHSHDAPPEPLGRTLEPGFSEQDGWRIYTEAAVSGTLVVQIAERDSDRDEEVLEAATGFLLPMALLTPLMSVVAWLLLRRFLRPVGMLRGEIADRRGDNLAPIRTEELPSELSSIAKSVNGLMRRLRMALDAEKEFTANAAHELRTPISGALAQTERLIAETPDGPARKRARQVKEALSGLAHLSERLLQLARADAGIAATAAPVDLEATARLVIGEVDGRGAVILERDGLPAPAAIDQDALGIVLRNLIGNALAHGAPGRPVVVRVGPGAALAVVNEGPVVPAEILAELTHRFQRGPTQAAGSGLGLAIVARILQQADGSLTLHSPAPGRTEGFAAVVQFRKA